MKYSSYVTVQGQVATPCPTSIIATNSRGRQTDFAPLVLVLLPDGSIGSRQAALDYDRQQLSTHYQHE